MTPSPALDMDSSHADYDALADLFLADEPLGRPLSPRPALKLAQDEAAGGSAAGSPAPASARGPKSTGSTAQPVLTIEGVLTGHLPVLASAWITQYSRHLADAHREPVALLRLASGQAVLDLILPAGYKIPADITPPPGEPLIGVLSRMGSRFRRWVIRVDEASEGALFGQPGLTRVAILTGGDDPAIVATYQAVKALAVSLTDRTPELSLVVMGAAEARADLAESKLRRAVQQFLSRALPPAVRIPKISSSLAVQVFRAPTSAGIAQVVEALKLARPSAEPLASAAPVRPAPALPVVEPAAAEVQATPHAEVPVPPAPPAPTDPATHLITQLRLTPVPITCPYAPSIRAAADAQGRLHLLALTDIDPADGASRLLTAASWANDHAALLTAAAPALKHAAEPMLHVLTTDAKLVRTLLDTGLRLHVVTSVEVAGQSVPAVIALN